MLELPRQHVVSLPSYENTTVSAFSLCLFVSQYYQYCSLSLSLSVSQYYQYCSLSLSLSVSQYYQYCSLSLSLYRNITSTVLPVWNILIQQVLNALLLQMAQGHFNYNGDHPGPGSV